MQADLFYGTFPAIEKKIPTLTIQIIEGVLRMKDKRPSEMFGELVFSRRVMAGRIPKDVNEKLQAAIEGREKLDNSVAGIVAAAMKEWALSKGATHYTHWFHPRTDLTAEKHMAFLNVDNEGLPLESFSGGELIQSEPDASSLPSGGMRSTFEARGYTAWDPTSPAFVVGNGDGATLCIPSVFFSYDGTPLDMKTPLLRAINAIEERALRLLRLFGNRGVKWVHATVGAEQEFFLVDEELARKRPDLLFCGRTLLGNLPPKGQQMEDHYFGSIHPRVLACMEEMEDELARLGIVVRTRHNEVGPGQFEFAPQFSEANLAADQNQIMMDIMRKTARKHGFRLLLHEKPFAGLNGSGKHTNFSLQDSEGRNLLNPSVSNQKRGLQFLAFLGALLLGASKHGGLLRACIASPGNMHRLGGNEAPPAIMSVYLGDFLNRLLEDIEEGLPEFGTIKGEIDLGLSRLPAIRSDNSDRNRTAPIAFTGNKFEFRAPGAPQSLGGPLTALFSLWAWGIEEVANRLEANLNAGKELPDAALDVIRHAAATSRNVRFEGNCYTQEWAEEAQRRGLPVAHSTPDALRLFLTPENRSLLADLGVMSEREIHAYYETRLHQFNTTMNIDMGVLASMVREGVLPALAKQITLEGNALSHLPAAAAEGPCGVVLEKLGRLKADLHEAVQRLEALQADLDTLPIEEEAEGMVRKAIPLLEGIRGMCNEVERNVALEFWPYPRYRELATLK